MGYEFNTGLQHWKVQPIFPIDFNLENTILPLLTRDNVVVLKDDISGNMKIQWDIIYMYNNFWFGTKVCFQNTDRLVSIYIYLSLQGRHGLMYQIIIKIFQTVRLLHCQFVWKWLMLILIMFHCTIQCAYIYKLPSQIRQAVNETGY